MGGGEAQGLEGGDLVVSVAETSNLTLFTFFQPEEKKRKKKVRLPDWGKLKQPG